MCIVQCSMFNFKYEDGLSNVGSIIILKKSLFNKKCKKQKNSLKFNGHCLMFNEYCSMFQTQCITFNDQCSMFIVYCVM